VIRASPKKQGSRCDDNFLKSSQWLGLFVGLLTTTPASSGDDV
jgi:hypothetical protein